MEDRFFDEDELRKPLSPYYVSGRHDDGSDDEEPYEEPYEAEDDDS